MTPHLIVYKLLGSMMLHHVLIIDDIEKATFSYQDYFNSKQTKLSFRTSKSILERFVRIADFDLVIINWPEIYMGADKFFMYLSSSISSTRTSIIVLYNQEKDFIFPDTSHLNFIDFVSIPILQNEFEYRINRLQQLMKNIKRTHLRNNELHELNAILNNQKGSLEDTFKLKLDYAKEKQSALQQRIEESRRKMVSYEIKNSKVLDNLKTLLKELDRFEKELEIMNSTSMRKSIKRFQGKLKEMIKEKDTKKEFMKLFEKVEPSFFKKLTQINARLTPLDLKHCAYIRLNLDNYDLADLLNVELKSLQMSRYRLKKKLELHKEQTLRGYILAL